MQVEAHAADRAPNAWAIHWLTGHTIKMPTAVPAMAPIQSAPVGRRNRKTCALSPRRVDHRHAAATAIQQASV
jgi:hypothetical protein